MAIVFPASPSTNDTFTAGSITYKWDGDKWIGLGVTPADRLVEGSNSLEIDANNNLVWSGDNIGINDTSPDNKLHITTTSSSAYSTNTTNTSNLTNALLKLQNLDGSDGTGVNNYVGIQFSVANGATSTAQLQYVRTGDNAGKFEFKARNGSTNYPNLLTLKSNNDIGINKPDPQQWGGGVPTIEIKGTVATGGNSTRSGAIAFESGSGSNGYAVLWGQEGGIHIYTSATDRDATTYSSKFHSDGNLHFADGKGIDFSADGNASGMTSELLNDYEEGTWSSTISGPVSLSAYNFLEGYYVKIGRLVHLTAEISYTPTSANTELGFVVEVPFAMGGNAAAYCGAGAVYWSHSRSSGVITDNTSSNATQVYVLLHSVSNTSTSNGFVRFGLTYVAT